MAPVSTIQICNMALARVGHSELIDDLDEQSTAAALCNLFIEQSRDAVLAARPWVWAKRRVTLALVVGTAPPPWSYQYRVPTDCITALELESAMPPAGLDQTSTFAIEADENGQLLLTHVSDARLIYTQRVEEPGRFSAPFVDALAWRLAYDLATPLKVSRQVRDSMLFQYGLALQAAGAHSLKQGQEGAPLDAASTRARL